MKSQRLPVIIALLAFNGVFALGACGRFFRDESVHWWVDIFWTIASLGAALKCFQTSRRVDGLGLRRAWQFFGLGCLSWFAGQMIWNFQELAQQNYSPFPGWADFGYLAMAPLFVWGIFHFRTEAPAAVTVVRKLCNLGILVTLVVSTVILAQAAPILDLHLSPGHVLAALSYTVFYSAAVIFGLICIPLYVPAGLRHVLGILLAGLAAHAIGNAYYAEAALAQSFSVGTGLDILWVAGFSLIYLAASQQGLMELRAVDMGSRGATPGYLEEVESILPALSILVIAAVGFWQHTRLSASIWDYLMPVLVLLAAFIGMREWWTRRWEMRLNHELRASEERYRAIIEDQVEFIVRWRPDGTRTFVNEAYARYFGQAQKSLIGTSFLPLIAPEEQEAVRKKIALLTPEHPTAADEHRAQRADGTWRWQQWVDRAIFDEAGKIVELQSVGRDIHDQKVAQLRLVENERFLTNLIENAADAILLHDFEGRLVRVNQRACESLGYTREELLQRNVWDVDAAFPTLKMLRPHWEQITGDRGVTLAGRHRRRDGTVFPVEVRLTRIETPEAPLLLAMVRDVTERQRAEQQLRESRLLLERAQQAGRIGSWVSSPDQGGYLEWSAETCRIFGVEPAEFDGRMETFKRLVHPHDLKLVLDISRAAIAGDMLYDVAHRIIRTDGSVRWVHEQAEVERDAEGKPIRMVGVVRDITEQKLAEEALQASESRYRSLAENSTMGIWQIDPQGYTVYANPAMCRLLDIEDTSELRGLTFHPFLTSEGLEVLQREHAKRIAGQPSSYEVELVSKQGRRLNVVISGAPLLGADGKLAGTIGTFMDVTEQKRAQVQLRESEARLRSFVEGAQDAIFSLSPDWVVTSLNPAFENILGWSRGEWLGKRLVPLIHPEDTAAALENLQKAIAGERPPTFELRLAARAGGHLALEFTITPQWHDQRVVGVLGIARDLRERRRLEEQLRQVQKMESIGQLAAGVAHDFNNILTIQQGYLSFLLTEMEEESHLSEPLREVLHASERAASLTRQLLLFSRRQVMQPRDLDLNEVVRNLTKMLGRILGEDIKLECDYASHLPMVFADAGMMEQIIVNLVVNARDAMPRGGKLAIRTDALAVDEIYEMKNAEAHPGRYVRLRVTDTGTGIAPENLRRIFEPFFTTKDIGQGTGLGLATVYGIVKQHQGWIEVTSEKGRGTEFTIFLPVRVAQAEVIAQPATAAPASGGSEVILVVEDEMAVRELVSHALGRLGYRVLVAANGVEALELWQRHAGEVDLLLTDMLMPEGLNGRELADRLCADRADLKVIYTSGYSPEMAAKDLALQEGVNYLQKPYRLQKLANTVRNCLDDAGEPLAESRW